MKKLISITIFALFLSLLTSTSNAAIKPGSLCKKIGATSSFSGKKYTCIKFSQRLIWNKDVVKVPSTAELDPNLPKENQTCDPMKNDDSYGYKSNYQLSFLICSFPPYPHWVSKGGSIFLSKGDNKTPILGSDAREKILFNAFDNFNKFKKPGELNVEYYVDPKFQSSFENMIKSGTETFQNLIGGYFQKRQNLYVVMITDKIFGENVFNHLAATGVFSRNLMNDQELNLVRYIDQRTSPQMSSAYATHENTQNILAVYISNPELRINLWKIGGVYHETYHQLQFDWSPNQTAVLPCWIVEGQPNFIALAMGYNQFGLEKTYVMLRQMWSNSKNDSVDLKKLEGQFNRVNGQTPCGNVGEYEQGAIANAYLINKFGMEKVMRIYTSANNFRPNTDDWVQQFQTITGESVDDFYHEAEPYISWFMSKYIKS